MNCYKCGLTIDQDVVTPSYRWMLLDQLQGLLTAHQRCAVDRDRTSLYPDVPIGDRNSARVEVGRASAAFIILAVLALILLYAMSLSIIAGTVDGQTIALGGAGLVVTVSGMARVAGNLRLLRELSKSNQRGERLPEP
jgi:hypothetical protein